MDNLFSKYRVVVGNIGMVCETSVESDADECFDSYVDASKSSTGMRASGEAVTLFEDGEPSKEHIGYQYMYENHGEELNELIALRRSEDPTHCPICPTPFEQEKAVLATADDDLTLVVARKCGNCGFPWKDVYRVVDVQLN